MQAWGEHPNSVQKAPSQSADSNLVEFMWYHGMTHTDMTHGSSS